MIEGTTEVATILPEGDGGERAHIWRSEAGPENLGTWPHYYFACDCGNASSPTRSIENAIASGVNHIQTYHKRGA